MHEFTEKDLPNQLLKNNEFFKQIKEVVEFGLLRNEKYFSNRYRDTSFCLYSKYTYEDVCRLLDWEKSEVALNIGGYKFDKNTKTYPIFINYEKDDNIKATQNYSDHFINNKTLIAISKSGRTTDSDDVKTALNAQRLGVKLDLFVRKNKDDDTSKEFYYLGRLNASGEAKNFVLKDTTKTAVEITYHLVNPVQEDIYEYLVS